MSGVSTWTAQAGFFAAARWAKRSKPREWFNENVLRRVGKASGSRECAPDGVPTLQSLLTGRPGLVIAGSRRPAAACQRRARGAVGGGRAGHVGDMRLFPLMRRVGLFGRRHIDGVMQPTVPGRRYPRGLG